MLALKLKLTFSLGDAAPSTLPPQNKLSAKGSFGRELAKKYNDDKLDGPVNKETGGLRGRGAGEQDENDWRERERARGGQKSTERLFEVCKVRAQASLLAKRTWNYSVPQLYTSESTCTAGSDAW